MPGERAAGRVGSAGAPTAIRMPSSHSPEELIRWLGLEPHPTEGGHFRETYRSSSGFDPGPPFTGRRSYSTAIYYLLTGETFSAMHRLPGDEVFHFYLGDPVEMLELLPTGEGRVTILGSELRTMRVQHVVPGGTWQGAHLLDGGRWALLGTTMAPGFSYDDYEPGTPELKRAFPAFEALIERRLVQDGA